MTGTVWESPKQGTSHTALHHTRTWKLVTAHEWCRVLALSRQRGPIPLGGILGERHWSMVQPLALSILWAPRGAGGDNVTAKPPAQAPCLAVSQHTRHPHCPDWDISAEDTATVPGLWMQPHCQTQGGQPEAGQGAN